MRILVTGAGGFIGRHVVTALSKTTNEIIVSGRDDISIRQHAWFPSVRFVPYDIENPGSGDDLFQYFGKPDVLIHLAWSGLNDFKHIAHFEHVLPAHCSFLKTYIQYGGTDLLVVGTCLEYGLAEGCLREQTVTNPVCAYGLAKDTLRKYLEELNKEYPFSLKWARLFYTYGEGQNQKAILPQLQKEIDRGGTVFNMSGGEQIRDYTPVEELATYLVKIALQNEETGIYNCCSGIPVSVRKLVEDYLQKQGVHIKLNLGYYPYADYEPFAFWGDKSKLNKILL